MEQLMMKLVPKILSKKVILGLLAALSIASNIFLYRSNLRLSEGLELAKNNVEAYQLMVSNQQVDNNALVLKILELKNSKDSILMDMTNKLDQANIKIKNLIAAATQTLTINVNGGKGVEKEIIYINTPTNSYTDSILFNDLTNVTYTIYEDSVDITLDISNTQYLFTHKKKEYKNKKSFFKRLFTLDFKKTWKYKYDIINSNDLINTSDVRVIEIND